MELELEGKVAIVTGGSSGIGKATASLLASEGANVVLAARSHDRLAAAARELADRTGRQVIGLATDTGNDASVRNMVQEAAAVFGRLDILVNCAAPKYPNPPGMGDTLENLRDSDLLHHLDVKVLGYLRCVREVAPYMRAQGWGRIINLGGMLARQSGSIIGSIRNTAVVALTKNLADELGPYGINVTAVHPGVTLTERRAAQIAERAAAQRVPPGEIEAEMARGNAIRKLVTANDIAHIIVFLASPKSVTINGDVIGATGGAGRAIYY